MKTSNGRFSFRKLIVAILLVVTGSLTGQAIMVQTGVTIASEDFVGVIERELTGLAEQSAKAKSELEVPAE